MATTAKKEKKLGIVIYNNAYLFANGIVQNAYFLHQCCEAMGYTCQLLCPEPSPVPFDHKGLSLKQITTDESIFNPSEYHTIVIFTSPISNEMYTLLKKHRVGVIIFVCGNNYMYDQEQFVNGIKGTRTSYMAKDIQADEQWLIPSYYHALDYMEIVRKKPAYLAPHLWSPEIVRYYTPSVIKQPESALFYSVEKRRSNKISIVIMEPNQNLFKTAWTPIVAAEKLHTMHPELIEFVYVFNFPSHPQAYNMTKALSLDSKIRKFERKSIAEVMYFFNNQPESMPIFVSHQVLNELNYLYYELLYYGFPLVHNSTMLDGCGYFFPENSISKCAEQIMSAHKHHNMGVETYKEKAKEYLKRVDPLDPGVQKIFDQFLTASIVKNSMI